jgi:hypothetical protein
MRGLFQCDAAGGGRQPWVMVWWMGAAQGCRRLKPERALLLGGEAMGGLSVA